MKARAVRIGLGVAGTMLAPVINAALRRRDAWVTLVYHRIAPEADAAYPPLTPEELRRHCEYLRRYLTVLPFEELLQRWSTGASLRGCCAVTFDDGYRDFIDYALPVLEEFKFPTVHFLVDDCVRTGRAPWTYRWNRLVQQGLAVGADRDRIAALPAADREAELASRTGDAPTAIGTPPMLRPAELRACASPLVEWGAHSLSHAFLDLVPAEEAQREIAESKRSLESQVGRPIRYFAYPNGRCSAMIAQFARTAGYDAALTVGNVALGRRDPARRHTLPRFDVGGLPSRLLGLEVGGTLSRLRRLRG